MFPLPDAYWPAAQSVHADTSDFVEYLPAPQSVQVLAPGFGPVLVTLPALQGLQLVSVCPEPASWYCPPGQSLQPSSFEYFSPLSHPDSTSTSTAAIITTKNILVVWLKHEVECEHLANDVVTVLCGMCAELMHLRLFLVLGFT